MPGSRKIPRVASIVAFIISALVIIAGLFGPIILLIFSMIPLAAAVGILRQRVWSAYGFAIYLLTQVVLVPIILILPAPKISAPQIVASMVLPSALAVLYFLAGRSLAAAGARRGLASPWIALAVLSAVPVLSMRAFVMPTSSMENTLLTGDRILVRHFPAPRIAEGDVIVFRYPVDRRETYVKRVIGMPGDRIKIVNKIVYRNGAALNEPYAVHKTDFMDAYRDNFPSEPSSFCTDACRNMLQNHVKNGEVVVPEGHYFVLGDNRDNSLDSRYWGFVDLKEFIGEPFLIYESEEPSPHGEFTGARRWNRLFKTL